jgi:hypothetical protein
MRGLEPPRPYGHGDLNAARLPIPPHPRVGAGDDIAPRPGVGERSCLPDLPLPLMQSSAGCTSIPRSALLASTTTRQAAIV